MYVCIEGIDGCGKDTQVDLLTAASRLIGCPVLRVAEPDSSLPTGQLLRQLLREGQLSLSHAALFLADRLALQQDKILPWYAAGAGDPLDGRMVVSARCFLSTLVYQQEQWPLDWLFDLHREMPRKPDRILVLDLDPERAAERMIKRNIHSECYERLPTQIRNRQRYRELMADPRMQTLLAPHGKILLVDASGTVEETHQRVMQALSEKHG
jgi:dTMP kinase